MLMQKMATCCSNSAKVLVSVFVMSCLLVASAGDLYQDLEITWGDHRAKMLNGGQLLTLSLDKASGSGFQSKHEYLFGRIDMQIKLVSGNSAGTVTAYYVCTSKSLFEICFHLFIPNISLLMIYLIHAVIFSRTNPR